MALKKRTISILLLTTLHALQIWFVVELNFETRTIDTIIIELHVVGGLCARVPRPFYTSNQKGKGQSCDFVCLWSWRGLFESLSSLLLHPNQPAEGTVESRRDEYCPRRGSQASGKYLKRQEKAWTPQRAVSWLQSCLFGLSAVMEVSLRPGF